MKPYTITSGLPMMLSVSVALVTIATYIGGWSFVLSNLIAANKLAISMLSSYYIDQLIVIDWFIV